MRNYQSHASVWVSAIQFTGEISSVASNVHSPRECLAFMRPRLCLQFACVAWWCPRELLHLPLSPLSVVLKNHCSSRLLYTALLSLGAQIGNTDEVYLYEIRHCAENITYCFVNYFLSWSIAMWWVCFCLTKQIKSLWPNWMGLKQTILSKGSLVKKSVRDWLSTAVFPCIPFGSLERAGF